MKLIANQSHAQCLIGVCTITLDTYPVATEDSVTVTVKGTSQLAQDVCDWLSKMPDSHNIPVQVIID